MTIAVYGATGFTGSMVCQALAGRKVAFKAVGRSETKLRSLAASLGGIPFQAAAHDDPRALDAAFHGVRAVIACAGPFIDVGIPVADAAIRAGAHYFDSTGEQAFVRYLLEHLEKQAVASGSALFPACAFEYALGDLAGALAVRGLGQPARLRVGYAVKDFTTSIGTKLSIVQVMASGGVGRVDGQTVARPFACAAWEIPLTPSKTVTGIWLPTAEPLLFHKHTPVETVEVFMAAGIPAGAARLAGPWLPAVGKLLGGAASAMISRFAAAPSAAESARAAYTVVAQGASPKATRTVRVAGQDPYAVTAAILAHAAAEIVARERVPAGIHGPAVVFDPAGFLARLPVSVAIDGG